MVKTDNSKRIHDVLVEYKHNLKSQRNWLVAWRVVVSILLSMVLLLIFILFSIRTKEGITCDIYSNKLLFRLDANGTDMLWIIVLLVIAGLVWMIVRTFRQLKRYQTCTRKLDIMLCKVAILNEDSEESLIRERICEELQSITSVFDKKCVNE